MQLKKILAPTDFSGHSAKAVRYAARLAQQFGAQLCLLHVNQPVTYVNEYTPTARIAEHEATQRRQAQEKLAQVDAQLHAGGETELTTGVHVREGVPHHEIVEHAREWEADLIVIATHGYTGLRHLLLGSHAERVVRHAPCPVLVVRDKERDFVA